MKQASHKNHYYKTKVIKMGKWNTPPLDAGTWYGEESNTFYKKTFGVPKGILTLYSGQDGYMHAYVPTSYFTELHARINQINKKDFKALEKILKSFYPLDKKAKKSVSHVYTNAAKLSNKQIAKAIWTIRHWVHHVAIFDQFAWIAEEYWTPRMKHVLVNELSIPEGSEEYNRVLFALSKPEAISTTLQEKKAVLEQAIKIKSGNSKLETSAKSLAKKLGWLPVFTYGPAWKADHYTEELTGVTKKKLSDLKKEFAELKNYKSIRNQEIQAVVKKFKLSKKSLQVFVDFGLAVDTRNEAEYFVSFGGGLLMPLFDQARTRLFLSPKQFRELTEEELLDILNGKTLLEKIQSQKGNNGGWGYDETMKTRLNFKPSEAEKLFHYIENYVKPIQGGDENRGTCASPGKVTGKIRIVPYPTENDKVKDGDILVTYATTTDYLPAMKRAAGIITEVGGLTCHAAVVSREFGIPCIVALANAMKNLKDGDMVEMDANKGTVKKVTS